MSGCPNCDHTMKNLGLAKDGIAVFYCTRCGCVKMMLDDGEPIVMIPSLVERVKAVTLMPGFGGVTISLNDWKDIDEASGFWKTGQGRP